MIPNTPLESLEHWEDDLKKRYPKPHQKQKKDYRNYADSPRDQLVRNFYKINHQYQTYDFVVSKQDEFPYPNHGSTRLSRQSYLV